MALFPAWHLNSALKRFTRMFNDYWQIWNVTALDSRSDLLVNFSKLPQLEHAVSIWGLASSALSAPFPCAAPCQEHQSEPLFAGRRIWAMGGRQLASPRWTGDSSWSLQSHHPQSRSSRSHHSWVQSSRPEGPWSTKAPPSWKRPKLWSPWLAEC